MSAVCMVVLRNAANREQVPGKITDIAVKNGYGINSAPYNSLLAEKSVVLADGDIAFEVLGDLENDCCELLVGFDDMCYDGHFPDKPLESRMYFIQSLIFTCLEFCASAELFISDDNGYLPDYSAYSLQPAAVAQTLLYEYEKTDPGDPFLPNIHIVAHFPTSANKTNH